MEELHEWGTRLEVSEDVQEKDGVFLDILRAIQVPGGSDGVKSLAAQLVSKHVATFSHHEDATIDALISLSQSGDGKQSQAVRIHAILGLVTFVKGQTMISLFLHEKLSRFVTATLARETSGVLLRHLTSLQKLLTPAPAATVASVTSSPASAAAPSEPAKPEPRRESIPPSPFLYIKGFLPGTNLGQLLEYFQNVDPTLTRSTIHLNKAAKPNYNAFLNCTTVDNARRMIEYASTHPFNGRNLVTLFARGPPVPSVVFHLASSYPTSPNDLDEIWPDVKAELQKLQKAAYVSTTVGKAKFDSMDVVKMLVTKGLTVRGQKIWVVYDFDEQSKVHDAQTKRSGNAATSSPAAPSSPLVSSSSSPVKTAVSSPSTRRDTPDKKVSTPPPSRQAGLLPSPAKPINSPAKASHSSPLRAAVDKMSPALRSTPPPSSPARSTAALLPLQTGSPSKPKPSSPDDQRRPPPNDRDDGQRAAQTPPRSNNSSRGNESRYAPSDNASPRNNASRGDNRPGDTRRATEPPHERRSLQPPPAFEVQRTPSLGEIARAGGSDKYDQLTRQRNHRDGPEQGGRGRADSRGSIDASNHRDDRRGLPDRRSRERPAARPQPTIGEVARAGGGSLSDRRSRSRDRPRPRSPISRPRSPLSRPRSPPPRPRSPPTRPRSPPSRPQQTIGDIARTGGGSLSTRPALAQSSQPPRRDSSLDRIGRSAGGSRGGASAAPSYESYGASSYNDRPTKDDRYRDDRRDGDRYAPRGSVDDSRLSKPPQQQVQRPPSRTLGEIARAGGGSMLNAPPPSVARPRSRSRSRGRVPDRGARSRSRGRPDTLPASAYSSRTPVPPPEPARGNSSPQSGRGSSTSSRVESQPNHRDEWSKTPGRNGSRNLPPGDGAASTKRKDHGDDNHSRNQRPRHEDGEGGAAAPAEFYAGRPQVDYSSAVYRPSRHDDGEDRASAKASQPSRSDQSNDDQRPSHQPEDKPSHRSDAAAAAHSRGPSPPSRSTPDRPLMARTIEILQTDKKDGGNYTPDSDTGSLKLRDILNPARSSQFDLDDECEVDYDEE